MRPISGQTERVRKLTYSWKNQVAASQSRSVAPRKGAYSTNGRSGSG